jgi:hypothetical protein
VIDINSELKPNYVYWLQDTKNADIFKTGYVGVTTRPKSRMSQHIFEANMKVKANKSFTDALVSGNVVMKIIFFGTKFECAVLENKLRPLQSIGWNINSGGGSVEGLSMRTLNKTRFTNLKSKVKSKSHLTWSNEFDTVEGVLNLIKMFDVVEESGKLLVLPSEGEVNLRTLKIESRSVMTRGMRKNLENSGLGVNTSDLAEKLGVKPNTITTQIKRGWSYEEIVKQERDTVIYNNLPYKGKLREEDLDKICDLMDKGVSISDVSSVLGVTTTHVRSIYNKYGGKYIGKF